ncbi:MAG: NAD(P)H-dependent oxidoreductase [Planctomycetaceae bacterium]|nr:NAD(P)H-dependent oxidoreductase [Planctomycetaceae bacterium]
MTTPKILAFSGSARKDSYNTRLVQVAVQGARDAGGEVTLLDLNDYPLPIFNEDLEADGTPENATKLKQLFITHDGLLISSPEYNSSITPLLKNVIDWVSRRAPGEEPLAAYQNKYAVLMAASPGALGGLRGLVHVRDILGNIGVTVLPQQIAISQAMHAFKETGELQDEEKHQRVRDLGARLARLLKAIHD